MNEIWKTITQFPDYEINDCGKVRRRTASRTGMPIGKEIKAHTSCGYSHIRLFRNNRAYNCLVHRLVADSFIGVIPHGHEVDHIDFNRTNNSVSNLRYVTRMENAHHSMNCGRLYQGEDHHSARLCIKDVKIIRILLQEKYPILRIAKFFGVARGAIQFIAKGKSWKSVKN